MPLQRRHHIDGQFADADVKSETWVCGLPACRNIFYPRLSQDDPRDNIDLKCWSCGYKAFSEVEGVAYEPNLSVTEIGLDSLRSNDEDQEPIANSIGKVDDREVVLHPVQGSLLFPKIEFFIKADMRSWSFF